MGVVEDQADPDLLAVVEFRYDPGAAHGWSVRVEAAGWMRTGAVGRLLREAADRYDPPHPLLDLSAEHHPECTCPRCQQVESALARIYGKLHGGRRPDVDVVDDL